MENDIARLLEAVADVKSLLKQTPRLDSEPEAGARNSRTSSQSGPVKNRPYPVMLDFEAWAADKKRA